MTKVRNWSTPCQARITLLRSKQSNNVLEMLFSSDHRLELRENILERKRSGMGNLLILVCWPNNLYGTTLEVGKRTQ